MNAADPKQLTVDEELRRQYEQAWNSQSSPPFERFLPNPDATSRLGTLVELVCIEMEHQWQRFETDPTFAPPRLSDYLQQFPELASPAATRELIEQELLLRQRSGDNAALADYAKFLPSGSAQLETLSDQSTLSPSRLERPDLDGPARLGNYQLLYCIGQGGMGQVFLARHLRLETLAAIKLLKADSSAGQLHSRFLREGRAAANVRHPNVAAAFDAGEDCGWSYIVFEFVAGRNLRQIVEASGPLCVEASIDCIRQAAIGLAHVHRCGIVHRDVKPANLMQDNDGVVKVLDLGLAGVREQADCSDLTSFDTLMGTVDYMAPEQGLDPRSATAVADVYSLGCTLYFLLTGRRMFDGPTLMARLLAHREKPAPRLGAMLPSGVELPETLEAIYLKMVAKRPEDRYASMELLLEALDACATPKPLEASTTHATSWRVGTAWPYAAAGILGLCVWAGFGAWPDRTPSFPLDTNPNSNPNQEQGARDGISGPVGSSAPSTPEWLMSRGIDVLVTDGQREFVLDAKHLSTSSELKLVGLELTASASVSDLLKALPLPTLTQVSLNTLPITTDELRTIVESQPRLARLNLGGCPLADVDLSCLSELNELHTLWVGRTGLDRRELLHIVEIRSLSYLWIGETDLRDEDMKTVAKMPNLMGLGLERTQVTGKCLAALAACDLQTLILDGTSISDADIAALTQMTTLQNVSVHDTAVTASGRRQLRAALPQCTVTPLDDHEAPRSNATIE